VPGGKTGLQSIGAYFRQSTQQKHAHSTTTE
jgi:hypothetical protein